LQDGAVADTFAYVHARLVPIRDCDLNNTRCNDTHTSTGDVCKHGMHKHRDVVQSGRQGGGHPGGWGRRGAQCPGGGRGGGGGAPRLDRRVDPIHPMHTGHTPETHPNMPEHTWPHPRVLVGDVGVEQGGARARRRYWMICACCVGTVPCASGSGRRAPSAVVAGWGGGMWRAYVPNRRVLNRRGVGIHERREQDVPKASPEE